MNAQFSERLTEVLTYSREEAVRLGNEYISIEHLFLGILREGENPTIDVLLSLGVQLLDIRQTIEEQIRQESSLDINRLDSLPFMRPTERVLKLIYLEARALQNDEIDTQHLMLAILKEENSLTAMALRELNIDYDKFKDSYLKYSPQARDSSGYGDEEMDEPGDFQSSAPKSDSDTPVLDNFGVDLTKAAEEKRLDPIVGREVEIERLAQILSRRKKNNPVLIGEPGVGKSAIVEGMASRIVKRQVSRVLFDKRIVTLDLASIVAGTKYRGQFEERIKAILNELSKNDNIILFIDEIHTIVGAGGATGSLDAANMLKPALARGEIQCIGATTLDEYRQHIEKDGALERRFQKVMVEATSPEETLEILNRIKERYEEHHNVNYTDEALNACIKLSMRYISDRYLPDKAIDALDESGSRVHISNIKVPKRIIELENEIEKTHDEKIKKVHEQDFEKAAQLRDEERKKTEELENAKQQWEKELIKHRETVTEENVAEVIAMMTGVPVKRIAQTEGMRLLKMGEELERSVVGQNQAIEKIVKAIQRNRAGLKDPAKPIGTFIFLGPTGVGKTQLAKVLAKYLFDSTDALLRVDMSEYMEKFAISRLVGAPPGYVGYEEGGQLTEKVRRKPYSIVLLDEIEKAHPDVFHILLQVLDEGRLTDSFGRQVDFRNTIVIMTSNIGSRELREFGQGVGFATSANVKSADDYSKGIIQKALKNAFAPEFINRLDDVIMFNALDKAAIHKIIDIELQGLFTRTEELGYKLELSVPAKEFIANKGFDQQYGARPLKRAIQKYLEDEMAELILKSDLKEGDTIKASFSKKEEKIEFKVKRNEKADQENSTSEKPGKN
ncbi:MAG: ATP-dependent Clp protease ATP-binding subunit [Salinivirgaceae bacterium]|jgi:ATP-dependent Clp protease ATP-binding subunit ClpC|nr:ATP-dependent Clp protease ATP-binding subunit [Salinivirgaceae bacterium]